jgi:polyphosphate kinase
VCADVNDVFMQLTGLGKASRLRHLWQSPFTLHAQLVAAIKKETEAAKAGKKAGVVAKMNALLEPEIIAELYDASKAGVKIDLIVRGVCCLRPGIQGLSENITVRSIIGRFLEHHRVFHFASTGNVYISSADWMDRNFFRRIEVCLPILEPKLQKRVIEEGLQKYLEDNTQAWVMNGDGHYERCKPGKAPPHSAQLELLQELASPQPPESLDLPLDRLRPKRKAKAGA